jgi:CheY-like chemotaxis protein
LVDDSEFSILIVSAFLDRMGHQVSAVTSGAEALRMIPLARPDIVLLDVVMPEMDGFETAARIRALILDRWVPLVFLTGNTEDAAISRGIEVGGDDYLIKPVAFVMLKAKLDAFARMLQMQRQLEQKSAELEQYYHAAEEEQRVGAHLMNQMVRADMPREPLLSYWIQPARNLSGDLVVATRTPDGVLHVLLADGTGHGLAASLNVLSIVDPFYAMTARGASLGTIASEVNGKIKRWLPIERYVAATLIAFDPAAERLEHLKRALAGHFAGGSANDDMAIAIIDCAPQPAAPRREEVPSVSVSGVCAGGGWRVRTRVTAQELKYLDVAPFLLEVVRRFHGIEAHAAQILLILSELFNNALDHGLLELDSRIKREPGGVERFLAMRRHRLDELSEGSVDIELEMIAAGNRPMLAIRIQDSGRGFDYRPLLAAGAGISASAVPHGRGIALVRNLCARLEYHGSGNGVSALYDLAQGI